MADCPNCQARDLKALKLARSFEAVTKGSDANQCAYAAAMHQAGARVRTELLGSWARQGEVAQLDRERRATEHAELSEGVRYSAPETAPEPETAPREGPESWWQR